MICSYCQSENDQFASDCEFCKAPLKAVRPSMDTYVVEEDFEKPFPILVTFHTYHLLLLLRKAREERTRMYHLMRGVQRGSQHVEVDSDTLAFAEQEYRYYTARMRVIEGILIDRMGYKPKRVDDKLLASLQAKIEKR